MNIRVSVLVLCFGLLVSPTVSFSKSPVRNKPLTHQKVQRSLKLAHWLLQRSVKRRVFLPRVVPLLVLEELLPAMSKIDDQSVFQALVRLAPSLGYKTQHFYSLWIQEWRRVVLAYDAIRWKMTKKRCAENQKNYKAWKEKAKKKNDGPIRTALLYKMRMCHVSRSDRQAIHVHKKALKAFFERIWAPVR